MLTAFLVGLFSFLHCYGMCGGIVGTLSMSLAPKIRNYRWHLIGFLALYNLGRITSYTVAGYLAGLTGKILATGLYPLLVASSLRIVAGILTITLGAYVAGLLPKLSYLERIGDPLWQRLLPLAQHLIPIRTWTQAWLFGIIWGFLPCGLVYSMLILAALSGSAWEGAWQMLAFGIGTLPGLIFSGILITKISYLQRTFWLRFIAGFTLIISGLITVWFNVIPKTQIYSTLSNSHSSTRTFGVHH